MSYLAICHQCLAAARRTCAGPCPCPHDPERADIIDHAARVSCPLGRFTGVSLPPPAPIPDDYDPEHERRRLRSGGCCGQPSKSE